MKFLAIISLSVFSTITMASEVWTMVGFDQFNLTSSQEISDTVQKYPEILNKWEDDISKLKLISLSLITFEYTGNTLCEEGDPKLSYESVSYILCPTTRVSMACTSVFDPGMFPTGDPCKL